MAGKREERKKARFHWLVTSWLIVAAVIIVGVGGIILFMNGLYHKEMRKENAQLPQMLESSRDAKWAYAFNGESQTESESESESQLESDSQSESKLQTESTEEQSIVSTVIEKEETQTQTQADVSSKAEPAHNVVIGDVKSEKPTCVSLVAVGDNLHLRVQARPAGHTVFLFHGGGPVQLGGQFDPDMLCKRDSAARERHQPVVRR